MLFPDLIRLTTSSFVAYRLRSFLGYRCRQRGGADPRRDRHKGDRANLPGATRRRAVVGGAGGVRHRARHRHPVQRVARAPRRAARPGDGSGEVVNMAVSRGAGNSNSK